MTRQRGPPDSRSRRAERGWTESRHPKTRQRQGETRGTDPGGWPLSPPANKNQASSGRAKDSTAGAPSPSREGKRSSTIMAFTPRFKEKIVTLTTLHDNLAPRLEEMPHLASVHAALASLILQVRELEARQDLLNG